MPYYKFTKNDVFYNRIKTYPKYEFFIYESKVYLNNKPKMPGQNVDNEGHVPTGHINLYELNVDRTNDNLVYPFVTKEGSLNSVGTVTSNQFASSFQYGDVLSGTYPHSASIVRERFASGSSRSRVEALRNTFNYHTRLSPYYSYSSSPSGHDKATEELNLITIPSIFYGSSIKKGSVDLKFYLSGTLIGELQDSRQNGELIQVGPVGSKNSGSVAGVVLYNEGFLVLTGSWDLTANDNLHDEEYVGDGSSEESPKWVYFAAGANDSHATGLMPSSSFSVGFKGVNYIPTLTMMAHAPKGLLNYSPNPTFVEQNSYITASAEAGPQAYIEPSNIPIKNIVSSSYYGYSEDFKKQTYISKVGIYDEQKNLIAIANLANPVKKRENDNYTFKLKLDF